MQRCQQRSEDQSEKTANHPLTEIFNLWILESQFLQLTLDALSFARFDCDLGYGDALSPDRCHHACLFTRQQEQQALPRALIARRPPNTMDVRVYAVGAVNLQHPVDR